VSEYYLNYPFVILILGLVIVLLMFIKTGLHRTNIPGLVGFLFIGAMIRLVDYQYPFVSEGFTEVFDFMAKIGLIFLLFRVGLESNMRGLLKQLRRASIIWSGDVLVSGFIGFLASYFILNLSWVTSIILATAFTATSVGISLSVWESTGNIKSRNGELLIDVAEMDDISAVVLMAMLFAIIPGIQNSENFHLFPVISKIFGKFLIKFILFSGLCVVFSLYVEKPVTKFFRKVEEPPDPMIVVIAMGFIIAALSELLGFSMAIGAFFAGLVFSRDPALLKMETSFIPLYDLFTPFFFLGIGLDIDPSSIGGAVGIASVLIIPAIISKLIADGIPVFVMNGYRSAVLIGASMVPRAEIAMIIMQRGLKKGNWAVPSDIFAAMVIVSMITCMISPFAVQKMLNKWPQKGETK
jgi:Kef-type K+ transport system membrane component KefB